MKNCQLEHKDYKGPKNQYPLSIIAHDINSPTNVGNLFRMVDALGVECLYLTGSSPKPPNHKIRKTSRATENFVNYKFDEDPLSVINILRDKGYMILALEITDTSSRLEDFALNSFGGVCLIIGSENSGVGQKYLDISDETVHIEMQGQNSSMNVSMATAIACYAIISKLKEG